jgi:hypothetical protein
MENRGVEEERKIEFWDGEGASGLVTRPGGEDRAR